MGWLLAGFIGSLAILWALAGAGRISHVKALRISILVIFAGAAAIPLVIVETPADYFRMLVVSLLSAGAFLGLYLGIVELGKFAGGKGLMEQLTDADEENRRRRVEAQKASRQTQDRGD